MSLIELSLKVNAVPGVALSLKLLPGRHELVHVGIRP